MKTVKVPTELEGLFAKAEETVAAYFGRRRDDPSQGTIEIFGERYVLIRAAALSVEFFAVARELWGPGRQAEADDFARNILFDLAHAVGSSDARRLHQRTGVTDPIAKLAAGPVHFAHTGWAYVDIHADSRPVAGPDYVLIYDHPYSFEADAWLEREGRAPFPVCIMNAGYSSGWCEESFGLPLAASEILCRARGDDACRFVMAPPARLEAHVRRYVDERPALAERVRGHQIPDFFARKRIEEELRRARDELELRVAERTAELERANRKLQEEMRTRKALEEQLLRSARLEAIARLAGGIAHDFNNLMGVVVGEASLLERTLPEGSDARPLAREIRETGEEAAALTRQLLHLSRAEARPPEPPSAAADRAMPRGTETILVVEDRPSLRQMICSMLAAQGYRVLEAPDADAALDTAGGHSERIDLLVTDVAMPRMNGRELADRLQASRTGLRVLYVSGYPDDELLRWGIELGAAELLAKPFTAEQLAQRVREVLDGRTPRD